MTLKAAFASLLDVIEDQDLARAVLGLGDAGTYIAMLTMTEAPDGSDETDPRLS